MSVSNSADDVTWTNIGTTPFFGTYSGKKALLEQLRAPLFGRLKTGIINTVERLAAEAQVVVAQTTGTAETHDSIPCNG